MKNTMTFYLRKFNKNDAAALYNALKDKRVIKHMASEGFTLESCQSIVEKSSEHWKKYNIGDYAVVCKETETIIGWAGFKFWQEKEFEILLVLSPKYWGLGHNIYLELINMAKNDFKLKKVYVLLPETRKSFRLIQKLGFEFCKKEEFHDEAFNKFVRNL